MFAGLGYGGSCFPKDVQAVVKTAQAAGYDFRILKAVEAVNETQKRLLFDMVNDHFGGDIKGKRFAVWGLAFKPNTDDMREAPAIVVINNLLAAGAEVTAFDPEAMEECQEHHLGAKIKYAKNPMETLDGCDALILVTEWNEFRRPDFDEVKRRLIGNVIFDGRNIYSRKTLEGLGFKYYGIGS